MTGIINEVGAVLGSLKLAGETIQTIVGLRDGTKIQTKVIELNGIILAAQSSAFAANLSQSALLDKVSALEQELVRLKKWDTDKQQYKLTQIGPGAFAYAPKPDADNAQVPHWLCVKCYDNSQRSMLQYQGRTPKNRESIYKCGTCKSELLVPWSRSPESVAEKEKPSKPHGTECPKCHEPEFRMESSKPHPIFGEVGTKLDSMKCSSCGYGEEQMRDVA